MIKTCIKSFIICAVVICCGAAAFGQQSITSEKRALIFELRDLTGTKNIKVEPEIKPNDLSGVLLRIVDSDKELNDEQKQDLRKTALAANDRLERDLREYLTDGKVTGELFDEIFVTEFDKAFTEEELREIVVFYRTPAGKKTASFLMNIMNQATNSFAKLLTKRMTDFLNLRLKEEVERLKQEIKRAKVASGDA